jgi:hypothetical protein
VEQDVTSSTQRYLGEHFYILLIQRKSQVIQFGPPLTDIQEQLG